MSPTWADEAPPPPVRLGLVGWLRASFKAVFLGLLVFGGLLILLVIRLVERPVHGLHRPWTPWITQGVCRGAFLIIGIRHITQGARMRHPGAVVSNHSSWLDIFALNARKRVYFVSKAEVARWPAIGWLAKATGTVFINRAAREARAQRAVFEARLEAGHKLLFFPEGTSSDGRRVLPFKSTLFAAFFTEHLREFIWIQPVTVVYRAPTDQPENFYGWWGDMEFGSHLLKILAAPRQGSVEVRYHPAVPASQFPDRKTLSRYCEETVRSAFPEHPVSAG